jgi:phenylpropionate dioxygenase-like ring-hydroxylating dioxygenase large terminal subunit
MTKTLARCLRSTTTAPLAEAYTIPAPWYLDPAMAELERSQCFGGNWQAVGCRPGWRNPGDYFTTEAGGRADSGCAWRGRR